MRLTVRDEELDQFTAEILRSYLVSTVRDMVSTTTRTAYSTCFAEGEDFTCGLFDAGGRMICQAQGVPVHTGALGEAVSYLISHAGEINDGDVFVHNDPYTGGTHLADGMVCRPIFARGELVGFAANRGHWTDIGGMTPGGWSGAAEHAVQEGVRIPGVRLMRARVVNEAVRGFILRNVRVSAQLWGDIQAQIASNVIAERRIRELIDRYGMRGYRDAIEAALSYSRRRFQLGLQRLPDDTVEGADFIEDDGRGGGPYWMRVRIEKKGTRVFVDFTGTDQQVMAPINSTLACTKASVVGALIAVTDPDIPLNDAVINAIEMVIPPGTLVNPSYPAPTFSASADPAARVAETMLRALAKLVPDRVPAGAYATGNNVVAGGVKADGQPYLWYNFESGGCGARRGLDGNSAEHHLMGNSKNESAEVWEARYPVRVLSYRLVDDSGGVGRWRGGLGTERRIKLLADARLSGVSDRHLSGPVGVDGGGPGRPNAFAIERDGLRKSLQEQFGLSSPSKFWALPLKAGDVFVTVQAGGGGYGDPLARDRGAVEFDLRQGYVSRESALRDYRNARGEAGAGHAAEVGVGPGELNVEAVEMPRDFTGYGDDPPVFEWPNQARLALNIVVNYEEGSERNRADGDEELEPLSEATYPAGPGERELAQESMYEFGSRVGIWRIVRLFDRYDIPATIFACALALERNRPAARAFVDRGYDFVGHGYRWISHFKMSEDQEREQIRKAVNSIRQVTGTRIRGWFTRPPQTVATRRILAEEGFLYDSGCYNDEIPFFQQVRGRPFMVVPYTLDVNDVRFWKGPSIFTADHFASYCIDAFDALYKEGGRAPRMMSVGLHPRIIGRPGRVQGLEKFLSHVRRHEDVWITSRSEIASFWAERFAPEGTWNWPLPGAEDRDTAGDLAER